MKAEQQKQCTADGYRQIGISGRKVPRGVRYIHSCLKNFKSVQYYKDDKDQKYEIDDDIQFAFFFRQHFVYKEIHD